MGNVMTSTDNIAHESQQEDVISLALPEEILVHILSYLPGKDLIHVCRCVCKSWKTIVDSATLWIRKCEREGVEIPTAAHSLHIDFRVLYFKNPYGRNLLKNWNAEGKLAGWDVIEGGDGFAIEDSTTSPGAKPIDPVEAGCTKCWSTSFGPSKKSQCIDLLTEGCNVAVLDDLRPSIETSVWTVARKDCASVFESRVCLLSAEKTILDEKDTRRVVEQWQDGCWVQLKHTFEDYPKGVRYIFYEDGGNDLQFWAGNYGPKMAAPTVRFRLKNKRM